jgi:hypothetical protein
MWSSGCRMPTQETSGRRLLKDRKLLPLDYIERLSQAYAFTLRSLNLVDRNDSVTEILAHTVIQIGASVHDPIEIAEETIKRLGVS